LRRYAKNDVIILDSIGVFNMSFRVKFFTFMLANIYPYFINVFDVQKLIISTSILILEEYSSYKTEHYSAYK